MSFPGRTIGERHVVIISLNGDRFELPGPTTVGDLLRQLNIDRRRVAVEHNLVVLRQGAFDSTPVTEGDRIEVVNFVGGGSELVNKSSPSARITTKRTKICG